MGLRNLSGKRGAKTAAAKAESPESPAKSEAPVGAQSDGSRDAAALAAKVAEETRNESAEKSGIAGLTRAKPGMNMHVKAVADLAFGMVNPF